MLMTNPMTNDFCRLKTVYVTFFVMDFVMENRESGGEILTLNPFIESEMIHIVYRNLYKNRLPMGLGSLAEGVNRTLALLRGLYCRGVNCPRKEILHEVCLIHINQQADCQDNNSSITLHVLIPTIPSGVPHSGCAF